MASDSQRRPAPARCMLITAVPSSYIQYYPWTGRNKVYLFNIVYQRARVITLSVPRLHQRSASITVRNRIYFIGGYPPATARAFCVPILEDSESCEVYECAHMCIARYSIGVAQCCGTQIYAVGGFLENGNYTGMCERYDIPLNRWARLPRLNEPRGGVSACEMRQFVYAVGGYSRACTKTIERIDVLDSSAGWEILRPRDDSMLWTAKQSCGVCRVNDEALLVFGGAVSGNFRWDVGRSVTLTNSTIRGAPEMPDECNFACHNNAAAMGGLVYSIPQENEQLHIYNLITKKWITVFVPW